jgi:hypothetical protein
MDWNTMLFAIGLIGFVVMMVRGCGGMAGGGCGMGHSRRQRHSTPPASPSDVSASRTAEDRA